MPTSGRTNDRNCRMFVVYKYSKMLSFVKIARVTVKVIVNRNEARTAKTLLLNVIRLIFNGFFIALEKK